MQQSGKLSFEQLNYYFVTSTLNKFFSQQIKRYSLNCFVKSNYTFITFFCLLCKRGWVWVRDGRGWGGVRIMLGQHERDAASRAARAIQPGRKLKRANCATLRFRHFLPPFPPPPKKKHVSELNMVGPETEPVPRQFWCCSSQH